MNRYPFQLIRILGLILLASVLFLFKVIPQEFPDRFQKDPRIGSQVFIPSGQYYIGSSDRLDNLPRKRMMFGGFYIDIHPVTNFQYAEFVDRSGYHPLGGFDIEVALKQPLLPATSLTFDDARAYAEFHQKRLPTEWEWEIAARSLQVDIIYATGSLPTIKTGNFFRYKQKNGVTPVLSYPPNKIGIYGMAGNIFEWTSSGYPEEQLSGPHIGKFSIKVLRGGAWTNIPHDVRVTTRTPFPASRSLEWLGFRCVSDKQVNR
jgi:formylglycine-generating enzyme required for sulfatase activity